jgi:hypothetical protein
MKYLYAILRQIENMIILQAKATPINVNGLSLNKHLTAYK